MLEYVPVGYPIEVWSADDIRDRYPDTAGQVTDDQYGVLFHADGALVAGTAPELIARFGQLIAELAGRAGTGADN